MAPVLLRRSPRTRSSPVATPKQKLSMRMPNYSCSSSSSSSSNNRTRSIRRCVAQDDHDCSPLLESDMISEESISEYKFHMDEAESDETFCYKTICTNSSSSRAFLDFFDFATSPELTTESTVHVFGMDCEWQPTWFRSAASCERVCVIQIFSPYSNTSLVFSAVEYQKLPSALESFLGNKNILKVGVNIMGDATRIARDFACPVRSIYNVARGPGGTKVLHHQGSSMEALVNFYCKPENKYHLDKDASKGVRLSDWGKFPLTETQVKYASLDAVLSFAIFYHQQSTNENQQPQEWDKKMTFSLHIIDAYTKLEIENAYPEDPKCQEKGKENFQVQANSNDNDSAKNSDFFKMMRNRSVEPPRKGTKSHPSGPPDALKGVNIIISGVLDSMTRDEMTSFVIKHGGTVSKSITKSLTHLVNDVDGTIGESKLKQCKAKNIPVVGEDHIFELVMKKIKRSQSQLR